MVVAPDALWPLVPVTGLLAPFCLLAYFYFGGYCLTYTQVVGRYQLGLAWFWLVVELSNTFLPSSSTSTASLSSGVPGARGFSSKAMMYQS
jgi:hypothetical protein